MSSGSFIHSSSWNPESPEPHPEVESLARNWGRRTTFANGAAWRGQRSGGAGIRVLVLLGTAPSHRPPSLQIICLDLSEEMALPKLESFNG